MTFRPDSTLFALRAMVADPALRPGDGAVAAYRQSLADQLSRKDQRTDDLAVIFRDNLSAMLRHLRDESVIDYDAPPPKTDDWEHLARAWRPDLDPWDTLLLAARRLDANARGMARSQGGVRDLIRG